MLAALTRGLHLDGLADTADGLGPLRGRERALQVMRAGDVGPFGVVTLVLDPAAAGRLPRRCCSTVDGGWLALAGGHGRRPGGHGPHRPAGGRRRGGSSLGAAVAGTVSRGWLAGTACCGRWRPWPPPRAAGHGSTAGRLAAGAPSCGWLAAEALRRRASARLGGVNGDVMGAMGEVTATVALLAAAVLLR